MSAQNWQFERSLRVLCDAVGPLPNTVRKGHYQVAESTANIYATEQKCVMRVISFIKVQNKSPFGRIFIKKSNSFIIQQFPQPMNGNLNSIVGHFAE